MGKVYTIAVKFTYDLYKLYLFKYRFKGKDYSYRWITPIFAESKEEAIELFNSRHMVDNCELSLWQSEGRNITKEVVCYSSTKNYSLNELQSLMNSKDFLHYCRQELGLERTIESLIK